MSTTETDKPRDTRHQREIPAQHQGPDFKHPQDLKIGQRVLDVFLGRNRVSTVVRRCPVSVRLSYVDGQGREHKYTESLRNLRRINEVARVEG